MPSFLHLKFTWDDLIYKYNVKELLPSSELHIHYLTYFIIFCVCENIYVLPISEFQLYNTVLSTIVTMSYIKSSELFIL